MADKDFQNVIFLVFELIKFFFKFQETFKKPTSTEEYRILHILFEIGLN